MTTAQEHAAEVAALAGIDLSAGSVVPVKNAVIVRRWDGMLSVVASDDLDVSSNAKGHYSVRRHRGDAAPVTLSVHDDKTAALAAMAEIVQGMAE